MKINSNVPAQTLKTGLSTIAQHQLKKPKKLPEGRI
jgi:hypothetical protein